VQPAGFSWSYIFWFSVTLGARPSAPCASAAFLCPFPIKKKRARDLEGRSRALSRVHRKVGGNCLWRRSSFFREEAEEMMHEHRGPMHSTTREGSAGAGPAAASTATRKTGQVLGKPKRDKSRKLCEHNKEKDKCGECGGKKRRVSRPSLCPHNRTRSRCKDCGGSGVCEHGRRRSHCKQCGGSIFCEHMRQRSRCKDCGGTGICEHKREVNPVFSREYSEQKCCVLSCWLADCSVADIVLLCVSAARQRSKCLECGTGAGVCIHARVKAYCKDCAAGMNGGGSICEHQRERSVCIDCQQQAGALCIHERPRATCQDCFPKELSKICEHKIIRKRCKDCLAQAGVSFRADAAKAKESHPVAKAPTVALPPPQASKDSAGGGVAGFAAKQNDNDGWDWMGDAGREDGVNGQGGIGSSAVPASRLAGGMGLAGTQDWVYKDAGASVSGLQWLAAPGAAATPAVRKKVTKVRLLCVFWHVVGGLRVLVLPCLPREKGAPGTRRREGRMRRRDTQTFRIRGLAVRVRGESCILLAEVPSPTRPTHP